MITRRDFLGGVSLVVASGLTPSMQAAAATPTPYPPGLSGLRGSQPGSFEAAHRLAFEGQEVSLDGAPVDAAYDLVVVGAGISGLAAAWFYREAAGGGARILILDNHDDFGGHARRNEFDLPDGTRLIGYGGSEALESPKANLSEEALYLLGSLGVDLSVFETAFDRGLYPSLGLSEGVFFDREHFGEDRLVSGLPSFVKPAESPKGQDWRAFLAAAPLSDSAREELRVLIEEPGDYLIGKTASGVAEHLQIVSYHRYLVDDAGLSEEAARFFRQQTHDYFALGPDSVPAYDAMLSGFPGFKGLSQELEGAGDDGDDEEPYIYHFPDGNASIARLLVRSLVPAVATGSTMSDIVTARFDYGWLDQLTNRVRIRLNATVLRVGQEEGGDQNVRLAYLRDGKIERVVARHAVLACYNMMVPHLMPEMPDSRKTALRSHVKAPLVYVSIAIRNWTSFVAAKVHSVHCPGSFYSTVKLDFPVSLGDYRAPRDPATPILLHLVHVPVTEGSGKSDVEQFREGRRKLMSMPFSDFETAAREQLERMFGSGGFVAQRDILAITVNRWPHGYAYYANTLFLPKGAALEPDPATIAPIGAIAIANSDSGWNAYAHEAIDQAFRAVGELVGEE